MDEKGFSIRIVTPIGVATEDTASEAKLPTAMGEIGILPHHTRYTGILGTGILEYKPLGGGGPARRVVSGGFCSFTDNVLTILADSYDSRESIGDARQLEAEKQTLAKVLQEGNTYDAEWSRAREKLLRIEAIESLTRL